MRAGDMQQPANTTLSANALTLFSLLLVHVAAGAIGGERRHQRLWWWHWGCATGDGACGTAETRDAAAFGAVGDDATAI